MDEKLKDKICNTVCPIGYPRCSQGTSCLIPTRLEQAFRDSGWIEPQHVMEKVAQAQLAHMIQQGWVKLPSEDELALWLCDHLNCTSRELAKELLKLLKGEKP